MKMRKLFAGIAAAATLLGGMALGAVSAQADDAATTADTAAITVKNSQEGHTYSAYKFASLTVDGDAVQVDTDADWVTAVTDA
ncbi:MAG: isopeptide-forming domain-containing fimbrial protein, partial [Bifidobacterium adolescentis]|nr:isopeptide-forming domain-containing fimbrial protein [Bifidobacterium adolescentis]